MKRGDFVGIAMHCLVDMIVGVLGIIRAGAAYLALDAHAPVDRIAMMLADADVRLVVEAHACTGGPAQVDGDDEDAVDFVGPDGAGGGGHDSGGGAGVHIVGHVSGPGIRTAPSMRIVSPLR